MCRLASVEAPPPEPSAVAPVAIEEKEKKDEPEYFGFLRLVRFGCGTTIVIP